MSTVAPHRQSFLNRTLDGVFGIDLRTLALFRVCLGAVMFADLCMRAVDLRTFYTDGGVMARDWVMAVNGLWRFSLHLANGETWFVALLFIVQAVAALALMLGWRARAAAFVVFVLEGSLLNRDPLVLLGGDILLNCLLFWAMFLPVGARFSVDSALSQKPLQETRHLSWASAGLLLQVLSVYFFSAILKNSREWWPEGTAVDFALQIDQYATWAGKYLRTYPWLTHALSLYVWALELVGPIVVLTPIFNRPLRFVVMLMLMSMHIGFLLCLRLGFFPFVSLTSLTVLAGGFIWNWLDHRRLKAEIAAGPQPLRIYYDRDCGFCLKSVLLLKTFLVLPRAQIAPAQDDARAGALLEANYSWVIIDHDDRAHMKWPAFVVLLRRSPLFAWLGWLLAPASLRGGWAVKPGNAVYDFVGRHRGGFGAFTGKALPFHERPFTAGPFAASFAAVMVVAMLAWNFCSIRWLPNALYAQLTPPFRVLRVDQLWDMFAPFPSKEDGWFVLPAQRVDGTEFDLVHPERRAVSYDKPAHVAAEFSNIRWHKYLERIWSAQFADNRLHYGRWLCRQWNGSHQGGEQLSSFKIVYMLEMSVPAGQTPSVEQRVLWRHECFDLPKPATP